VGQARHDYFLRAADLGRAIAFVAETPRGDSSRTWQLQPEATLGRQKLAKSSHSAKRGCVMTSRYDDAGRETRAGEGEQMTPTVARVSGASEEHGHLEEFRTDPIG